MAGDAHAPSLTPDTLRRVDRWLGLPLCVVASALAWLAARFGGRHHRPGPPQRVLFIGLAEMGSVILAAPALRCAGERYRAHPYFVVLASARDSLRLLQAVPDERVFALRADGIFVLAFDILRFMLWCRRERIDATLDLEPFTRCSVLLAWLSGARCRSGFLPTSGLGLYRGHLLSCGRPYSAEMHMATQFVGLVEALFSPWRPRRGAGDGRLPMIRPYRVSAAERAAVRDRLAALAPGLATRPLVLINPHVGDLLPQRRWPAVNFVELVRALLAAYPEVGVGLIGAASEGEAGRRLAAAIGEARCVSVAGAFPLVLLPALFESSRLLISSDSGPAHFAAVTALPVIALFGPETPQRYAPLGAARVLYADLPCSPCVTPRNQRRSACRDNRCMQAITVASVLAEARTILDWDARPRCRRETA